MSPSLPLRFLLVCALLFAQVGGLAHGIAHAIAQQSQEQSLPHDKLCDLCASFAQLGNALGSTPLHFAAVAQCLVFEAHSVPNFHPSTFSAFAARAPPIST